MVKPIDHDGLSAASTGVSGAIKGSILGVLAIATVAALPGLLLGAGVGAAAGAIISGMGWTAASTATAAWAGAGILGAIAGLGAGITGGVLGFTPGIVGGGLVGLMKGGSKASAEKAAFQARADRRGGIDEARRMQDIQQGYQMGAMEAKQAIMAQLQQAHAQMLMANNGLSQEPGAQAAKVDASRAAGLGSPAIA